MFLQLSSSCLLAMRQLSSLIILEHTDANGGWTRYSSILTVIYHRLRPLKVEYIGWAPGNESPDSETIGGIYNH